MKAKILLAGILFAAAAHAQEDDVAAMVKELKLRADDAKPELIEKIAKTKTREALDGLLAAYDVVGSIFMKRELVRGLAWFDGERNMQQPALEHVANVATNSIEPELREAAIGVLDRSESLGKHFLKTIVDSKADDSVREMALAAHVRRAAEEDLEWYRFIWNPELERRKDDDGNIEAFELEAVREVAFAGASRFLDDDELVETMRRETNPKIRRAALGALDERNSKRTAEMARWLFERVDFPGPDRANAARIMTRLEGARVLGDFLKAAKKNDAVTPGDLKQTMAELLVQMNDEKVNKALAKQIGKGKRDQKVFALEATMHLGDETLIKHIRKGLKDRDVEVRRATAMALAERRDEGSLEELEKMMERPKTPEDFAIAIEAITTIKGADAEWLKSLSRFANHEERDVRNAALQAIGKTKDAHWLGLVHDATTHADWSTRLIAYEALRRMRDKSSVPKLIERLAAEKGRMSKAVAETLWSLTAMPFDEDLARWQTWWSGEGDGFQVVSLSDLAKAKKEREMKRLMARTRSENKFFGIRIESNRVIFIIDTSGSMLETMHGRYIGKRQATRIDIAKEELSRCIKELEPGSLFNVMSFSSGIGFWMKDGIASSSEATREQALEFVDRLGAQGATNLFDPIKIAFEDPDVDTIFILSDGEPTAGEILDPFRIRERVREWNEHRNIEIHTIAIGGNLEVLEWLAADSGGKHVRMR